MVDSINSILEKADREWIARLPNEPLRARAAAELEHFAAWHRVIGANPGLHVCPYSHPELVELATRASELREALVFAGEDPHWNVE